MDIGIIGGGVAGVSMSIFLSDKIRSTILESSSAKGGLASSFCYQGFYYDVGPHIIFSRNKEVLNFMLKVGDKDLLEHSRSNQIWYKGKLIQYPFENYLGLLDKKEKEMCLEDFLNNPYSDYEPQNMYQFFLKKFGYSITEKYLLPYNKKIWKFSPSFLDLQMVERIPNPPKEDVVSGAENEFVEGYQHQAKFFYPKSGGILSFFNKLTTYIPKNSNMKNNHQVKKIKKNKNKWIVECENKEIFSFDRIVNCMPIHNFFDVLEMAIPKSTKQSLRNLKYNSMFVGIIIFSSDNAGNNFSLNIPDESIIFHRISKLNFLGEKHPPNKSAFLFEITFIKGSSISKLKSDEIKDQVIDGFESMNLAKRFDCIGFEVQTIPKAYVVYDLNHRKNTDIALEFLKKNNISFCGRFAEFEYMNMDHVIESAMKKSNEIALSLNL